MGKKEMLKCETCGSWIDPETGETLPPSKGNAKKITDLTERIETLQANLKTALEKNEELLEKLKGKTDNEPENKRSFIDEI